MIVLGRIRRQIERGEDRAEEQPRSVCTRNQVGVLALPAEAGRLCQRLLHHRRGIDEDFDVAAGVLDQPASKRLQPRLDHIVVVVALRIDRDGAAQALLQDRERIVLRTVIDAEHDDRARVFPQCARIAAAVGVSRHPIHVAVDAVGQELPQPLGRVRHCVGPRDAERVEARGAGRLRQRALGRSRGQKSRLA